MNIKLFSLVLTFLLLFGGYFVVEYLQACETCNVAVATKTVTDGFEKIDIIFAYLNFGIAIFSIYLITKRKFSASAILSGVVAGLQTVAIGAIMLNI